MTPDPLDSAALLQKMIGRIASLRAMLARSPARTIVTPEDEPALALAEQLLRQMAERTAQEPQ